MKFFFATLLLLPIGRKIGWWFSRNILYQTPVPTSILLSIIWATSISGLFYWLIDWASPGGILRWIMGYFLGCYIAIPNFGLFDESSIPPDAQFRHLIISNLPIITYIVASIIFNYAFPHTKVV